MAENNWMKTLIVGATIAGSITGISYFHHQTNKVAYETFPARLEAVGKYISNPSYKEYMKKRMELADKIAASSFFGYHNVNHKLDQVLGDYEFNLDRLE